MKVLAITCGALCACSSAMAFIQPANINTRSFTNGGAPLSISTSSSSSTSTTMLFGIGEKKTDKGGNSAAGRPIAENGVRVTEKTKLQQDDVNWLGPAVQRRMDYERRLAAKRETQLRMKGEFSQKQFEQYTLARQEVPSGGKDYWVQIAARVDGQTPETCKRFTESQLYAQAAGTQANFFKSYIEVKETPMIVDESADVMGKLNNFLFGKKK